MNNIFSGAIARFLLGGGNVHELTLCQHIIERLQDEAQTRDYQRVRKLILEVGLLAGVDVEALRFAFTVVSRGTLAEGAKLEIQRPAGEGVCLACRARVAVSEYGQACPVCGDHGLGINGGDQLRIKQLEVE